MHASSRNEPAITKVTLRRAALVARAVARVCLGNMSSIPNPPETAIASSSACSSPSPPAAAPPDVEIALSRPAYRLGGTVVGTVRVLIPNGGGNGDSSDQQHRGRSAASGGGPRSDEGEAAATVSGSDNVGTTSEASTNGATNHAVCMLREAIESLDLALVGRCRLDSRWHNVRHHQRQRAAAAADQEGLELITGKLPPLPSESSTKKKASAAAASSSEGVDDDSTFCFWTTKPVNLLELKERRRGRWEDVKPKPIRLPGMMTASDDRTTSRQQQHQQPRPLPSSSSSAAATAESESSGSESGTTRGTTTMPLEERQLAFTFRADIPPDLPHSMSGASCRYYYSVAVRVRLKKKQRQKDPTTSAGRRLKLERWYQVPILVLTPNPGTAATTNETGAPSPAGKIRVSSCQAVAHSSGLPCAVTAVELTASPGGQLAVNRRGCALYRHVNHRQSPGHLQTMRVADPAGSPVCILTIIGAMKPMYPGCRMVVKLDFPVGNAIAGERRGHWVPCYQVSACLQGEEYARKPDGSRAKAKTFLFDAAYERIDPDCAERVSLHLTLPPDAPCSIETPIVSISIRCVVDIATKKQGRGGGYQNLRLEVPCEVVHGVASHESKEEEDDTANVPTIDELLGYDCDDDGDGVLRTDPKHPLSFPTKDIGDELKILSLLMADKCGLR